MARLFVAALLTIGYEDGRIEFWDTAAWEIGRGFSVLDGWSPWSSFRDNRTEPKAVPRIRSIAVSADNKLLAVGTSDAITRMWNIETGKEIGFFPK